MTSHSKRSSTISVPITNLSFPEECTPFKGSLGDMCRTNTIHAVHSTEFGMPQFIPTRNPIHQSSTYYSSSSPSNVSTSFKTLFKKHPSQLSTSRILIDTKDRSFFEHKPSKFKSLCGESAVFGAPASFVGRCPGQGKIQFKLTEDPRNQFCLKNPTRIHFKPVKQSVELAKVKELVKTSENVVSASESSASNSSLCEIIDLANPLGLDFQGTDYKNTYERDEQTIQNQMEYRKVRRFQHRRNVQLEIANTTEKEQQAERIAIPKYFKVDSPPPSAPIGCSKIVHDERYSYGKLVRAEQKPEVVQHLRKEDETRRQRYKQLYIKKNQKIAEKNEYDLNIEKAKIEQRSTALAEKDVYDLVSLLEGDLKIKKMQALPISEKKIIPHNIAGTIKFRREMKQSKRILRDRAIVKQNFYKKLEISKKIPEAELEISSDSSKSPNLTRSEEQASNDEDDLVVGQKGSNYFLRGFRYKMGSDLRGKFNKHISTVKDGKMMGCITRAEWFESLVFKDNQKIVKKDGEPSLFPRKVGLKPFHLTSAVKEFRKKPLGCHYDRSVEKKLHIRKPKTMKVRKFNLIGYLYGSTRKNISKTTIRGSPKTSTEDYMRNKIEKSMLKQKAQKYRRIRYLGIPCPEKHQKRNTNFRCVDSDSGDSEWIPDETAIEDINTEQNIDQRGRGNMPASETRETTLRRHPRHFRGYNLLRVPSAILNEFVQNQHTPVLRKLKNDKLILENVRSVKNTDYARKFGARHHHDHWNPTQHKSVNVRYARKIARPKPLQIKPQVILKKTKTFDKAQPRDSKLKEAHDFSNQKLDIDEIIRNHKSISKVDARKQNVNQHILLQTKDTIIHSLNDGEFQEFPGRDKFLQFIHEIKSQLNRRSGTVNSEDAVIQKTYIDELKEDLQSIESCLTSLSSSECTNLSNDSGSFLMAGDKKIPLDYLRKSVVPFEEMKRRRIEAVPIDASKEKLNPYRTVPFAGQQKDQSVKTSTKDNFFTFNTRLKNDMRQRLEVKSEAPQKKLLGPVLAKRVGRKAIAQVATDFDAHYIEDLKEASPLKTFKWKSCRTMIKDALRKKFESMLIQGEIVRAKINDHRNLEYYQQMMKSKELFEKLFAKWEKKEYEAAMEIVNKVKPYYEATDVYRREYQELSKQYTVLNMDVVYIENDWKRLTILQNFHYLLADMEWRIEHHWIHRTADGCLEGFQESIANRSLVNIRQRAKDDAWAIKEYYENVFLKNPHPIIVVFSNTTEFTSGIDNLKSKTFVLLLELHYTLWILTELKQRHQTFRDWCSVELKSKKKFAENKCANKYFMEDRARKLKDQANMFLGNPIDDTFGDHELSHINGICNEVYKDLIPEADQMNLSTLEQVAAISDLLGDLMGTLEIIPVAQRARVEKKHRRLLTYRRNISKQAVLVERRIASELVKVQCNMAPPFEKPKRTSKLPRLHFKKKIQVQEKRQASISEQTKFFYKAFHEEGSLPEGLQEARDSLDVIQGIQQSIAYGREYQ